MTEQTHAGTARGRFLHAVQKELAEFERRETEFSKMLRKERAAELQLPGIRDNSAEFGGARNRTDRNCDGMMRGSRVATQVDQNRF
jgi:hypothetical protein